MNVPVLIHFADFPQDGDRRQYAGGVVQVGDDDQLGSRSDFAADGFRVQCPTVFFKTGNWFEHGSDVSQGIDEQAVCGELDQDFITRFQQGGECEIVRH